MQFVKYTVAVLGLSACLSAAELVKKFPAHWGEPPAIQTRDYVELPGGYGHGSSTLAHWITSNLQKDQSRLAAVPPPKTAPLFENDFEKCEPGELPDDFLVLNGNFAVKADGDNKLLELPGAPLESFTVLFGPTEKSNVVMTARIFGTSKGRLYPTFGVGLCGLGGYRLQASPGKRALELFKGDNLIASVPHKWPSGEWACFRLQVRQVKDGEWKVEGKCWPQSETEPKNWQIAFEENEEPISGRASVWGSPFSGTPIRFDDLLVTRVATK